MRLKTGGPGFQICVPGPKRKVADRFTRFNLQGRGLVLPARLTCAFNWHTCVNWARVLMRAQLTRGRQSGT